MTESNKRPTWCQHPVILGLACGLAAFLVFTVVVATIPPAWAISIPIGNLFVVDLGDVAPLVGAFVLLMTWYEARQAKKRAIASEKTAAAGVAKIEAVSHQIDGLLADRDKAKVKEGEAKAEQVGKNTAETLAKGQREGAALERASIAATNQVPLVTNGKQPLPVVDERTGGASERVAEATERLAAAEEKKLKPGK